MHKDRHTLTPPYTLSPTHLAPGAHHHVDAQLHGSHVAGQDVRLAGAQPRGRGRVHAAVGHRAAAAHHSHGGAALAVAAAVPGAQEGLPVLRGGEGKGERVKGERGKVEGEWCSVHALACTQSLRL